MSDLLANIYDPLIAPLDFLGVRRWREWTTRAARGRTLEIGVGTGLNLPHYRTARAIAAIDPDGASLTRAMYRRNGNAVALYQARAEELPFADESFDAVVGTLTFCSIGDPERAAREVWRVLKRGGTLRLVEHVRVENRLIARAQDVLTPLWREMAGNCHLNRDTVRIIARAGFRVRVVNRLVASLFVGIDAVKEIGD
ncbi:MAG: class I SAM-dependent methyltransferase [Anaerolineae bacterium]|nr:class I SAM-dependent methyltransferase [Anaerolineae bacterium]